MPHYKPNRALNRHQLETIAWQVTPADYRGGSGSRRSVLMNSPEGTTLVPLSELTDNQLRRYIGPKALEEGGDMKKNGRSSAGFGISTYDQSLIESNAEGLDADDQKRAAREGFLKSGRITSAGWEQLSEDIRILEDNALYWLKEQFLSARDDGHAGADEALVGSVSFDPANQEQVDLINQGLGDRIDFVDSPPGINLYNVVWKNVSDFGASVLGGHIEFFDVEGLEGEHRANTRRPSSAHSARDRKPGMPDEGGLHQDKALLKQFVEMAAESMEIENWQDADCTSEVIEVARNYDKDLWATLKQVVDEYPPKDNAGAWDLWDANAPYLVLMTLRGEGVGIWDGDWDQFYSDADIQRIEKIFKRNLGGDHCYASSASSGSLENAFINAACETTGGCNDYSKNASRRSAKADEVAARELSLYIENEYSLVGAPNSQGKAIEKNLLRKIRNGSFDLELSEKAWMHLIESGAKKYAKEYADPGEWSQIFTKPTRELVAHEFAVSFWEEHKPR